MKSIRTTLLYVATIVGLSGCHCMPVTECYSDHVDCIADSECHMDRFYRPCLDVTRWGMWNCPCCACRQNQRR